MPASTWLGSELEIGIGIGSGSGSGLGLGLGLGLELHLAPAQHEGGERVDVRLDRGGAARDLRWEIGEI